MARHWVWTRRRCECGASVNRSSRPGESYESYLKERRRAEPSGHCEVGQEAAKERVEQGVGDRTAGCGDHDGGTDMAHKAEHAHDGRFTEARRVTQRAYRIRWKKPVKSSRTTRNIVNEYMKTRVAKWSGTRAMATTSWLSWSNEYRSYISEPERGGRKWKDKQAEQAATYANRRRIRGTRGKRLIRVTRTTFRALPRSGRHATNAFAKTRKYTQAPPHARGRIQSRDSDAQSHRQGHAEGIRGAQRQSDRCFIALRLDHRRTFCPAAIHRASTWPFRRITSSLNLPTKLSP